jgi:hypothetical protein
MEIQFIGMQLLSPNQSTPTSICAACLVVQKAYRLALATNEAWSPFRYALSSACTQMHPLTPGSQSSTPYNPRSSTGAKSTT